MSTKTYDAKSVVITFGGVPITGFADGTFVKITASEDLFKRKVGADGEVARSRTNNDTHGVEITLMQTSLSNSFLTTILSADRLDNSGVKPLSITDLSGGSIGFWAEAWIKKDPDVEYGMEVGSRSWSFETGQVSSMLVNGV